MEQQPALDDLLQRCAVRLVVPDGHGTGFFVAPRRILTCAHVVISATANQTAVKAYWNGQSYTAQVVDSRADPNVDLALLEIDLAKHPCVFLSQEAKPFNKLYSYGYPTDYTDGAAATFEVEGRIGGQQEHLKFKQGQVQPGMSGAPLLNWETGGVCGIVQFTRNRSSDLGGDALLTTRVLQEFPEFVDKQKQFHQQDRGWYDCLTQQQREALGLLPSSPGIEVFFLYADVDEDKKLVDKLQRHLAVMQKQKLITAWNKGKMMTPGGDEKNQISAYIERAKIILLLVSSDFMALHYLGGTEVEQAMEKRKTGTIVIPVLLRPADYRGTPFEGITPLPINRKPVTEWSNADSALLEVVQGIRKVVEGMKNANLC